MRKPTRNAIILGQNRYLIIKLLVQKKTIREIAKAIGVTYYPLYDYLATGAILHDDKEKNTKL